MPEIPFFLDGSVPYTGAISGAGTQMTGFAGRIAVNAALVADPSKLVVYQNTGALRAIRRDQISSMTSSPAHHWPIRHKPASARKPLRFSALYPRSSARY